MRLVAELSEAEQGLFSSTRYAGSLGGELWRRLQVTLDYAGGYMRLLAAHQHQDAAVTVTNSPTR